MKTKVRIGLDLNTRGNFHNSGPIDLLIDKDDTIEDWNGDTLINISDYQARRVMNHFCGMKDCRCGSNPLIEIGWEQWALHPNTII